MNRPFRWLTVFSGATVAAVCCLIVIPLVAGQGFNIGGVKIQANPSNDDDGNMNVDRQNNDQPSDRSGRRRTRGSSQASNNRPSSNSSNAPNQPQVFGGQHPNQPTNNAPRIQFQGKQVQNLPGNAPPRDWNQGGPNSWAVGGWQGDRWQGSRNAREWTQAFGGNQQPFSSQWYNDHPKAWRYDSRGSQTNLWVGGTLPGVYGFLGWGNVPTQYRASYGNVPQFDRSHYGEWYPLGVYSLMAGRGDPGTRMVQLAVDQHGHLAGNYYDMITNSNFSLTGDIRQQSQRVAWSLNKNPNVRFRVPLHQLLQPYGTLTVQLPGGDQQWQFVRLEN